MNIHRVDYLLVLGASELKSEYPATRPKVMQPCALPCLNDTAWMY